MRPVLFIILLTTLTACKAHEPVIKVGAENLETLLEMCASKNVGIVANHTSLIKGVHLVDTLLHYVPADFNILSVFGPEHGFRGQADAGVMIEDNIDIKSGLPVVSLYGSHKKPDPKDLESIDLIIFDIQDIGVRFYTYISTMHYVMEACAENGIPLVILDRPNPNGNYIDGPIMEEKFMSFVGMHPIPVVHGLTMGELAQMINGEGWLKDGIQCDLQIIPCQNYSHESKYELPVKPSPNLPNQHSIKIYPSTCFFEGTVISEGRGTLNPFEVYGHPELKGDYSFTPRSITGMSAYPKFEGILCFGMDLRSYEPAHGWTRLDMSFLLNAYNDFPRKDEFFLPYLEKLAGTASLRKQIEEGWSEAEIRRSWDSGLDVYLRLRSKYLIYD